MIAVKNDKKPVEVRRLEYLLRNYRTYKAGIRNLQKQLEYIMPSSTPSYDPVKGSSGPFVSTSETERYAIARIESNIAVEIQEKIRMYQLIVDSIDSAVQGLTEVERQFVELRYFLDLSVERTAEELGYSQKNIFVIRNAVIGKLLISLYGLIHSWTQNERFLDYF